MPLQIFCDEFGNTGARLLPTDQPVLVYAFMMIEPAALATARERILLTLQERAAETLELKSSRLLKSLRGRSPFKEIGHHVSELGARVSLSIVEKRCQACSMIAETYLDPELHDFAPKEMRERRFRQKFADACYDTLIDKRLIDFLSAVDGDAPEDIAVVGQRFFETLRFHPDEFVSHAAHCIETRLDRVFRYRQMREGLPKNSHLPQASMRPFIRDWNVWRPVCAVYARRVHYCVTRMRSLVRRSMRPLREAANSISSLGPGHTALLDN